MRVVVKGTHVELTPALNAYIEEKLVASMRKFMDNRDSSLPLLEIEFERTTRHHHKGKIWRAEANMTFGKIMIRGEAYGEDPHEAIDLLEEELKREVKSFKEKTKTKARTTARDIKRKLKRTR